MPDAVTQLGRLLAVSEGRMTFVAADDPTLRIGVAETVYEHFRAEAPVMSDADDMRDHALGMIAAMADAGDPRVTVARV